MGRSEHVQKSDKIRQTTIIHHPTITGADSESSDDEDNEDGNANSNGNPWFIDVPLKEFIDYLPDDKMLYYYGSQTEPDCRETITWIVN